MEGKSREAKWQFVQRILYEHADAIEHYIVTGNFPPVSDKSSENGKTTPTNPNKLHPTQSNSTPSDADVESKPQSMLSNDADYVEGQGQDEASVEISKHSTTISHFSQARTSRY